MPKVTVHITYTLSGNPYNGQVDGNTYPPIRLEPIPFTSYITLDRSPGDPDGEYSNASVPDGSYNLVVDNSISGYTVSPALPYGISVSGSDVYEEFQLDNDGPDIIVTILNSGDSSPVVGAIVRMSGVDARITGATGVAQLPANNGDPYSDLQAFYSNVSIGGPYSGTVGATTEYVNMTADDLSCQQWYNGCTGDSLSEYGTSYTTTSSGLFTCLSMSGGTQNPPYTALAGIGFEGSVEAGPNIGACQDAVYDLSSVEFAGSPSGGTWSGDGVTAGSPQYFVASGLTPGAHTLTYTVDDCADVRSVIVGDSVDAGSDQTICSGGSIELTGESPSGGYWECPSSPSSISGNYFNASGLDAGDYTVNYVVELYDGVTPLGVYCSGSKTIHVGLGISPVISVSIVNNQTVISVPDEYTAYQWYKDDVLISGAESFQYTALESGTYRIDVTGSGGSCDSSASIVLDVTSTASFPHTDLCEDYEERSTISVHNLPLCQASESFTTMSRNSMPSGKYSIEYDAGLDIKMTKTGKWLYMGCSSETIVYDSPPHLGIGNSNVVYDSGYVYGSRFPADALLMEVRLTDRQMSNSAKDDRRGISPCRTFNKQSVFADDDLHSLMVMHYENCIDNSASFHALYDRLFLVEGQFNEAAAFTLSPLIVDNLQYVDINEGTIMMWVKRLCVERGTRYYLIDMQPFKSTSLIEPTFSLYIDERNRLTFEIVGFVPIAGTAYVRKDSYAVRYPIKGTDLDDINKFNHIAITWKNDNIDTSLNFMRLYINGVKQSILKYDTGAKFGVADLTEEEKVMGDYIAHSVVGPEPCDPGGGSSYCTAIGTPTSIGEDTIVDSTALWNSNQFANKWVIMQVNQFDPTRDQVRKVVANTGQVISVDKPWDPVPQSVAGVKYVVCGQAYFISARLDKFMQVKLPQVGLPSSIQGLKEYWSQFVLGKCEGFPNSTLIPTNSCQPSQIGFEEWIDKLNFGASYKWDAVPVDIVDISSAGKELELRHLSVANSANLYDFPHIYIGSNRRGAQLGYVAIDQLAFYSRALTDDELSVYYGPTFINTENSEVKLGYDFDATSTPVYKFTTLQDEMGRTFETYINVLNPFSLPLDRELLTDLLNMVKPANSLFFVNYEQ